jgi:hypothetical protein
VKFQQQSYSREFTPLITPLATNKTVQIRKIIHEKTAKVDPPSPIPSDSAAEKERKELPFQNECPAIESVSAGMIPFGV